MSIVDSTWKKRTISSQLSTRFYEAKHLQMRIVSPTLWRHLLLVVFCVIAASCFSNVSASARAGRTLNMADLISSAASKLLGVNIADGVANLVSVAFGQPPERRGDPSEAHGASYGAQGESQPSTPSLFTGLLKLVGLDPNKLGALALNAIIFVAQMVSNTLIGKSPSAPLLHKPQPQMRYPTVSSVYPAYPMPAGAGHYNGHFRTYSGAAPKKDNDVDPEGTPLSWMLNSPLLKDSNIMHTAQDPNLSDQLEQVVGSRTKRAAGSQYEKTTTPCIQQLICRSAPFVWAMQRSLNDLLDPSTASNTANVWNTLTPVQRMYAYLPAATEIDHRAKICREKLPACQGTVL